MGKKKVTMSLTDFLGDAAPRDVLPDRPQNWADEVDGFEESGGTFAPRREGMFGERRDERGGRERDGGFGGGPEVERDWGSLRDRTAPGGGGGVPGVDRDRSPPRVSMADTTDDWGKAKREAPRDAFPGDGVGGPERRFGSGFGGGGGDRRGGGFSDAPLRPPGEMPSGPPYTAFFGNLPYEVKKEDLERFCAGLSVRDVRITKHIDTGNPKGAYVEFATVEDLKGCIERNGQDLLGRSLRIDVAEGRSGGVGSREDRFGGGSWGQGSSGFAPAPLVQESGGGGYVDDGRNWGERKAEAFSARSDDRGGFDRGGGGGGFDRGGFDRGGGGGFDRGGFDRGGAPPVGERKKLVLQRRSPEDQAALDAKRAQAGASSQSSLFGGAKPVDTLAREREIEERRAAREEEERQRKEEEKAKRAEEEAEKQAKIDAQLEERRRRREEIENGTARPPEVAATAAAGGVEARPAQERGGGRKDERGAAVPKVPTEPSRADEADQWTRKAPLPPSKPRRERKEPAVAAGVERKARPIKPRGEGDSSSGDGWKRGGPKEGGAPRARQGRAEDRKEGPGPEGKKLLKREPKAERKSDVNEDGTVNPKKTAKAIVAEKATEVKETEVTNAFALLDTDE